MFQCMHHFPVLRMIQGCEIGIRSTMVGMFVTTQEHSPLYRLFSGKEDASEAAMHQSAAEGAGCLPNIIC